MSLAVVRLERGDAFSARRLARLAVKGMSGNQQGLARVQLALIEQRAGAPAAALVAYASALPQLQRHHDKVGEARLRNNRGILNAYRGQATAAERDLVRAAELWDELGRGVMAAEARWNLGFAAGLRGDLVTALQRFETAGAQLDAAGALRGMSFLDRCQVLLAAGLIDDARTAIDAGIAQLSQGDVVSDVAEARLLLSETLLLTGQASEGAAAAEQARAEFELQGRPRFVLLAEFALLRATWQDPLASAWVNVDRTISALEEAGWTEAAVEVVLLSARRTVEANQTPDAETRERVMAATRSGPAARRMRAWHVVALVRIAANSNAAASRALLAGLRVHDDSRATVSATELQVHASARAAELAQTGLLLAATSGEPARVLRWAERWRAGSLLTRPVRPPNDPELANALTELRSATAELQLARSSGEDASRPERRQRSAERRVMERARATRAELATARTTDVRMLNDELGERALVEFVAVAGQLSAIVVADGRASLHRLGDASAVTHQLEILRFAHGRLAAGSSARMVAAVRASLTSAAQQLNDMLVLPLMGRLQERGLVVVPTGELHALPWALLPHVGGRAITVAPSASVWLSALDRRQSRRGHTVLVAGPGLPGAREEVAAVATVYGRGTRTYVSGAASVGAVTDALEGASYAHIAAHGRFRADNPLFSHLEMADGPLTVFDLERVRRAPTIVVLSACDSGLSSIHAGDEIMGLVAALLRIGTRALVASVAPVPDDVARDTMVAFHKGLARGIAPAQALAGARDGLDDTGRSQAAAFVCFGGG
jgi:CHAT domain-containing protein